MRCRNRRRNGDELGGRSLRNWRSEGLGKRFSGEKGLRVDQVPVDVDDLGGWLHLEFVGDFFDGF